MGRRSTEADRHTGYDGLYVYMINDGPHSMFLPQHATIPRSKSGNILYETQRTQSRESSNSERPSCHNGKVSETHTDHTTFKARNRVNEGGWFGAFIKSHFRST